MGTKKNLKQKAVSGVFWTSIQRYSKMGISFISGIILARLLTPFDYGCIGMLSIFMVLAESLVDGGFGSALIQKRNTTQDDYSTIFYWNIGVAVILYFVLYVSAPAISRFYKIPLLQSVLRVQGIVLFIHAFNIVQQNQLMKRMNFKVLSVVTLLSSVIAVTITIFLAYRGAGVWALVATNLINATIPAVAYWFYAKWIPSWRFSLKSFKELFSFGFFMFLTNLINNFSSQIQGLFIGRLYNPSTMGYYSKAHTTERLASNVVSSVMSQVTYPLYAEVQDDKEAMTNIIKKITITISYLTFPLLCVLILIAKPMFVMLYSEKWLQSVPYFQILCVAGMGGCLTSVNSQTIAAIGKSMVMFNWTVVKRVVGISFIVGGLFCWGMKGLLLGVVINHWFSYFVNIWLVSKYIGYKWTRQLFDLLPVICANAFFILISYLCVQTVNLSMYMDGFFKMMIFVSLYVVWSFVFKPVPFRLTRSILYTNLLKRKK